MPFYGNITNRRNQFTYDKIYPSKTALLQAISDTTINIGDNIITILPSKDDGVFIGRYVLIDYDYGQDSYALDRETTEQQNSIIKDESLKLQVKNWDSTVWQKTFINNELRYVLIAELNSEPPVFEIERYSPGYLENGEKIPVDVVQIDKNKYSIKIQDNYSLQLKAENPIINSEALNEKIPDTFVEGLPESKFTLGYSSSGAEYKDGTNLNDTINIDIDLRQVGNAVSRLYDLLYSKQRLIYDVQMLPTNNIQKNGIYRLNNSSYYIYIGDLGPDATYSASNWLCFLENNTNGSLHALAAMKSLYTALKQYEHNGFIITEDQLDRILYDYGWTNKESIVEWRYEGIMELFYNKKENNVHYINVPSSAESLPENILCGTIKFTELFNEGDVIFLQKNDIHIGTFDVYDLTGTRAKNNIWKSDTIGILNFDITGFDINDKNTVIENGKVFLQSAYPIWS